MGGVGVEAITADQLGNRISGFYDVCARPGLSSMNLARALARWAQENGIDEHSIQRLEQLAIQIRQKELRYDPSCIKRTLDGAMPNTLRWYPPRSHTAYIYYEVRLDIPRNKNEGKAVGWGSMQQWRDPRSHTIQPKLIYTTASKPRYGLKAFIVDDEWYVKLHGGTSQQYNYTGLVSPTRSSRMDGLPNNLAPQGLELFELFSREGLAPGALNYYIASIYNSQIAAEFLEQTGSGNAFGIRLPASHEMAIACRLATAGRVMRDLFWLKYLADGATTLDASSLRPFSSDLLQRVGMVRKQSSSRRFKKHEVWAVGSDFSARLTAGERLKQAKDSYDDACTKLSTGRGNVIRQAEMLRSLGVKPTKCLPDILVETALDDSLDKQQATETAIPL